MTDSSTLTVSGYTFTPALVSGHPDVFQSPHFTLAKPVWAPDDQFSRCELCSSKFSGLKRRHHCRVCGAVRCAKCCNEKIPLPQLGIEEAERVCDSCKGVTEFVTKARSTILSFLVESAKGLAAFSGQDQNIRKLVELGGVQTLVTLAAADDGVVRGHVVSGLHSLTTQDGLLKYLSDAGAIKAVCKILSSHGDKSEQVAVDGLSTILIFCKSHTFRAKVIEDGGLPQLLHFSRSARDPIALVALRSVCEMAGSQANHALIFDARDNAVGRLLQLCGSEIEQLKEVALRTLAHLSTGSHDHRHRLVQEDFSCGRCVQKVFDSTNEPQVACVAACLVANLAVSPQDQTGMQDLLHSACAKLQEAESQTEYLCHLTRALANFGQHRQNNAKLVSSLPSIVKFCLQSGIVPVQCQSMRLILSLLTQTSQPVVDVLLRNGADNLLTSLAELPSLLTTLTPSLLTQAPDVIAP